ncbi:MAG: DUF1800 domain-containing protein [Actinomycetota bacterium]|nr:DUF1800 domain-containing protein [Actinomycetota bacterium]
MARRRRRHGKKQSTRRAPKLPVHRGSFGPREAERLLWRAGFGPGRGEAQALAAKGLDGAVLSLTRPPAAHLEGPEPTDDNGRPLAPRERWGHDHVWWLDRMVRSNQPLVERMTLVWHDWFATSRQGVDARLMIDQNELFRRHALGSFAKLLVAVTRDPAMLVWLSGNENTKWSPNENYARELMELFTLGAGRGYTEHDVREQARALTGFRNDWRDGAGPVNFRFERKLHDAGRKRVFRRRGAFGWRDACRLCLDHRSHPSFFVRKLWSVFVAGDPDPATQRGLEALYLRSRHGVRPVVEAILRHPQLYEGPRLVKPPAVFVAGMLRTLGRGIDSDDWSWIGGLTGQKLFEPPNVAGWDESRWLDTATVRGRWIAANHALEGRTIDPRGDYDATEDAPTAVRSALAFWGEPTISAETRARLLAFAERCQAGADRAWKQRPYRAQRQNALRMLIATSPDLQTS